MVNDDELERAAKQLANFRTDNTLPDILDRYTALIADYRRLKSDYEEERDSREKYKQIAKGQERNPFVLVLIDGDGYVFNGNLVSTGVEGGRSAAQLLNEAIKTSLRTKGLDHCQIMVRVWANLAGLSKTLHKAGLAGPEKRSLSPFVASFNRSYGLFDFADAGEWKENADFKLRAMLNLYAENTQCKHIYFAACHDVGYISDLTTHIGNNERFTLITSPGIKFHDEYVKLGLGIEEFPGVFHPTSLGATSVYQSPRSSSTSTKTAATVTPSATLSYFDYSEAGERKICHFYRIGKCKYGNNCNKLHVDDDTNIYM
ncbi:uncharacterized protein TRIVIDRAFT_30240 [Trichoderma virens Gv29-8]|uniref:C3H1-type domain-containing protein n=1 Tax=Hypocrea virens (strain Gv29-8 / FGSC 10586) TaxID=413071 RepID=G9ML56_HYPVG|nr:uncharacterized protein TRIVIDRAFT_30240 [Trichoderma virens Gv29-8]EHK24950.1 hypothetical protein TRIVIDRAFT_30240 [Trichoderma virens Gv29-8]